MGTGLWIASPARATPECLKLHTATLRAQTVQPDGYFFVDDNPEDEASTVLLRELGDVLSPCDEARQFKKRCRPFYHDWTNETLLAIGHMRTQCIMEARRRRARWLLMCDVDNMIEPTLTEKLLSVDAAVVTPTLQTPYQTGHWNVWQSGGYQSNTRDEYYKAVQGKRGGAYLAECKAKFKASLSSGQNVCVGGTSGCWLIDLDRLPCRCDFNPLEYMALPADWGEDIFFALRCSLFGVEIVARTDCDVFHCYGENQLSQAWERIAAWGIEVPEQRSPAYGTHVAVLRTIARARQVRSVIEYGCGHFSTSAFLDRSIFPDLQSCVSLETDAFWAKKVEAMLSGDDRLTVVCDGASRLRNRALAAAPADLLFIDGPTKNREQDIRHAHENHLAPLIVAHDAEDERSYGYHRVFPEFKHRWTYTGERPWTAVLSDEVDVECMASSVLA